MLVAISRRISARGRKDEVSFDGFKAVNDLSFYVDDNGSASSSPERRGRPPCSI